MIILFFQVFEAYGPRIKMDFDNVNFTYHSIKLHNRCYLTDDAGGISISDENMRHLLWEQTTRHDFFPWDRGILNRKKNKNGKNT